MNSIAFARFGRRFLVAVLLASFGWTTLAFAQPTITAQTGDQTVNAGDTATFSVTVTGSPPFSYQWRKSLAPGNSNSIPGATSPSLVIANAQSSDDAGYYCQINDSTGAAYTDNAHLTVVVNGVAPTIVSQTGDQTVNAGDTATVSVTANGTAPLSYQWRKTVDGVADDIPGATSSSYIITNAQSSDTARYYCQVSNSYGVAWSDNRLLTVVGDSGAAPTIVSETGDQTVNAGDTATVSVSASGSAPLSYQWRKTVAGVASDIPGATSSSYVIANAQASDTARYYCQVSNSYGVAWSDNNLLTVVAGGVAPSIVSQTGDQTVNAGDTATVSVTANGSVPLSYQWRKTVEGVADDIPGATSSSYVIANAQSSARYYCQVSNSYGVAWSDNHLLTVITGDQPPVITQQPIGHNVTAGSSVAFSVTATSSTPMTYQWKHGTTNVGTNSSTYSIGSVQSGDEGDYSCMVTNSVGSTPSSIAHLTIGPAGDFALLEQPRSQHLIRGSSVAFSVTTRGGTGSPTYQWWHGGAQVTSSTATTDTLIMHDLTEADAGTYYVIVTNAGTEYTSVPANLAVEPPPAADHPVVIEVHTAAPKVLVVVLQSETKYLERYEPSEAHPQPYPEEDNLSAYLDGLWKLDNNDPIPAAKIHRYSVPWDEDALNSDGRFPVKTRHRIYLELPAPLTEGSHTIKTPLSDVPVPFEFHADTTFCESIKVNQVGYSGGTGRMRYANFGIFMGDGRTTFFDVTSQPANQPAETAPHYRVINEKTGATALTGDAAIPSADDTAMAYGPNPDRMAFQSSGERVYRIDLSALPPGGPYFVSVDGAGRSRSFGVGPSYSDHLDYVAFRGLYHQRCGMALEADYTAWTHASCHNEIALWRRSPLPQDEVIFDGDTSMHQISGGYHDAADMDHTPAHPQISSNMLSFFEAFREELETRRYNIPQKTPAGERPIPDFLEEILWGVKLWENLQVKEGDPAFDALGGAVMCGWSAKGTTMYGYEDADHDSNLKYSSMSVNHFILPRDMNGDNKVDDYEGLEYDGTNRSTALAAGIFAHASRMVRYYNVQRANELLASARKAWAFLTAPSGLGVDYPKAHIIYAALQLSLATDNQQERDVCRAVFLRQARSFFIDGESLRPGQTPQPDADRDGYDPGNNYLSCNTAHFVSYLFTDPFPGDDGLQQALKNRLLLRADHGGGFFTLPTDPQSTYPFGIKNTDQDGGGTMSWGSATTQGRYADVLMYAYRLKSDELSNATPEQAPALQQAMKTYLDCISLFADYSVGLNPLGVSYYTGLGTDQPNSPLQCNSWTTKYGHPVQDSSNTWVHLDAAQNPIGNVPGILIYGPALDEPGQSYELPLSRKLYPHWTSLPPQRRWVDGWSVIKVNEFTTHETIVWNLLMYAFLASH
jgi:endoglucanase